jgi:succinate--hydroxymethylglutarate CoA-transferase
LEDPHLQARNMVVDIQHPQMGAIKTHNSPIMMNGSSCGIAKGENPLEPELGQDNEAVLKQYLDLDSEQIAAFYDEGILWSEKKEG